MDEDPAGRAGPVVAIVLIALALPCPPASSQSPSPRPSPAPSASPSPSAAPSGSQPIRSSVERVVDKMESQREDPCKKAGAEGRPCFPVSTTAGPVYSVRDSLAEALGKGGGRAPAGAPTVSEMSRYRPGSQTPIVGITFDPGCMAKSALKSLKGKNDVYYLYRLRDVHGERVALYDWKIDPSAFQGEVAFLGRFVGECDALAAYHHEELIHPPSPAPKPAPQPSPSAAPRAQ
jgi:hypothetical protein